MRSLRRKVWHSESLSQHKNRLINGGNVTDKLPKVVDLPQANSDVCGEEGVMRALQRTFDENDELMRLLADS
jgi:hypothetical protein